MFFFNFKSISAFILHSWRYAFKLYKIWKCDFPHSHKGKFEIGLGTLNLWIWTNTSPLDTRLPWYRMEHWTFTTFLKPQWFAYAMAHFRQTDHVKVDPSHIVQYPISCFWESVACYPSQRCNPISDYIQRTQISSHEVSSTATCSCKHKSTQYHIKHPYEKRVAQSNDGILNLKNKIMKGSQSDHVTLWEYR